MSFRDYLDKHDRKIKKNTRNPFEHKSSDHKKSTEVIEETKKVSTKEKINLKDPVEHANAILEGAGYETPVEITKDQEDEIDHADLLM